MHKKNVQKIINSFGELNNIMQLLKIQKVKTKRKFQSSSEAYGKNSSRK
jgi:hypothetical protein